MSKDHLIRSVFPTSGILLLLLLSGCGEHADKQDTSRSTEARFRDYKVIISESDENMTPGGDSSRVDIFKGSHLLYTRYSHQFSVGTHFDGDEMDTAPIGTDVTGNGQPDLVISEWTGGAHGLFSLHIFEIGDKFHEIQTIELEYSGAVFKNLDNDPALELLMNDWTFAYWNTCFADSPAPKVILKYSNGHYRMAPNLMKKLPQHQAELSALAAKIKLLPDWAVPDSNFSIPGIKGVPPGLWGEMLDLIYSGNMAQAWKLLDLAWPEGMSGKQKFLEEFKAHLATSPFWEEIQNMNKRGAK